MFGIIGLGMKKLDHPIAPIVLAMVIGDRAEDAFRQSMIMSQGSIGVLWSSPLVGVLSTLAIVLLLVPVLTSLRARRHKGHVEEEVPSE